MSGDAREDFDADLAGFAVPSGPNRDAGRDELERLASRLAEQVRTGRSGEMDTVPDDPELAARLREIAPVVEALEQWKLTKAAECGEGPLPATLPVDRLGDYRLVRELGRGGNAIVFEAVEESAGRTVALKVFPRRAPKDSPFRRRFLEEAATMSRLRHPNIVPVYKLAEDGGYAFYVMRLAEGGSLDRVISQLRRPASAPASGRLRRDDWRGVAQLGRQVARAVAFGHSQGVVHGDVKPANVLLDREGQGLVADFGPKPRPEPGARGRLTGTYRYMAPERFDGVCDERSDVYSLGATLYELLALTPAYEAEGQDSLVRSVLRHELIAPRLVRPGVPPELDAVVLKAMAHDPGRRYRSAAELADDLLNFLHGRRVTARESGGLLARWKRWRGGRG
jgi:eukaryotic-like serine/threonine-protein kinase